MGDFANFNGGKNDSGSAKDDFMKEATAAAARYNGRNENELVGEIFARAAAKRKKLQKIVERLKSM